MSLSATKINRQYRRETLRAMEPKERLYLTFDLAWRAANEGDEKRLLSLLLLLRKAVRFEAAPLIALNALRLYRHCEWLINEKQDFPAVAHVFFELKRALKSAVDRPETPAEMERREKVRRAKGILYFGKHGLHYGPNPKRAQRVRPDAGQVVVPAKAGVETNVVAAGKKS